MNIDKKINLWSEEDKPIVSKLRKTYGTLSSLIFIYEEKMASYMLFIAGDKDKDFLYRLKDNDNFKSIPLDFEALILTSEIANKHKGERCMIFDAYPNNAPIPESEKEYMDNVKEYVYLPDSKELKLYKHNNSITENFEITKELKKLIAKINI